MIVREIICDICERTIVYKGFGFKKGLKIWINLFKDVHICEDCMEEIKNKVLETETK